jgi:hypothetical protein
MRPPSPFPTHTHTPCLSSVCVCNRAWVGRDAGRRSGGSGSCRRPHAAAWCWRAPRRCTDYTRSYMPCSATATAACPSYSAPHPFCTRASARCRHARPQPTTSLACFSPLMMAVHVGVHAEPCVAAGAASSDRGRRSAHAAPGDCIHSDVARAHLPGHRRCTAHARPPRFRPCPGRRRRPGPDRPHTHVCVCICSVNILYRYIHTCIERTADTSPARFRHGACGAYPTPRFSPRVTAPHALRCGTGGALRTHPPARPP